MKILVTFAVEAEFTPWRRRRGFRQVSAAGGPLYAAQFGGADVRVALTGLGLEPAAQAVAAALAERPDSVISSGLAGGLRPEYRTTEVLVARGVRLAGSGAVLESEPSLFETAVGCGATPVKRFLTAQELVRSASHKAALGAEADAVEMESYAVLAAAEHAGIPAVVVRAVSDSWDTDLPYGIARDAAGRVRIGALFGQVALRPQRLPALLRLARECRRAAAALAEFLDIYVCVLAEQGVPSEFESAVAAT